LAHGDLAAVITLPGTCYGEAIAGVNEGLTAFNPLGQSMAIWDGIFTTY
jgi:hypothetical protein